MNHTENRKATTIPKQSPPFTERVDSYSTGKKFT